MAALRSFAVFALAVFDRWRVGQWIAGMFAGAAAVASDVPALRLALAALFVGLACAEGSSRLRRRWSS